MRAVQVRRHGGPEVLELDDIPIPRVQPGKVLVRVVVSGLNFADVLRRRGDYPEAIRLPSTAGIEMAGVVEAIGDGVAGLRKGQRVMGFGRGAFAEYVLTIPSLLYPIPKGIDWITAAALPVQGLTAYHTLATAGQLQRDETVLINSAAGGVGLLAVQVAKLLGAGLVIGAASTSSKRDTVRSMGADLALDYTSDGYPKRVREHTGGRGVDVILDGVGGEIFQRSLDALAPFGRLVVSGQASGGTIVDPDRLVVPNQCIVGFSLTGYLTPPARVRRSMKLLAQWVASGQLKVVVSRRFPLGRVAEAQIALETRQTVGKVVLDVSPD